MAKGSLVSLFCYFLIDVCRVSFSNRKSRRGGSATPGRYSILHYNIIPVVPHKAVAEVSKIGNLQERLVVVNHGWQSESTDGPEGGWSCAF